MAWLSGLFLFQAGRHDEAKPHWEWCEKLGGHWAQSAGQMLAQIDGIKTFQAERARRDAGPVAREPKLAAEQ